MGITGLLPYLKPSSRSITVREFSGQTVAVDTYCWLHKGAFACAEKLGVGQDTDQYVQYCMRYLRLLLSNRLRVVLVFDGRNLPAKADVERKRRESRAAYKRKALQLLAEGRSAEAREAFERCIDVTPGMALALMRAARREGADTIVAPYEADAQLTHLCNAGLVDAVISEDSDLLAFGCRRVIFKLDSQGNGMLIERSEVARQLCIPAADDENDSAMSAGMTWPKFRWMCILSGCDYFPGVPGVGLATAAGIVRRTCLDLRSLANKLFLYAKKIQRLTKDQVEAVVRADLTFQYQVVFDPIKRCQCRLNQPPSSAEAGLDFAGCVLLDNELGLQLAHGNIDFHTMQSVANFDPDAGNNHGDDDKGKLGHRTTTNSSSNLSNQNCSVIWSGGSNRRQRKVASEASLGVGVDISASPYFTGAALTSSCGGGNALWRSESNGGSVTDRLCQLYSGLSSESLLAAEKATLMEGAESVDEKENSDASVHQADCDTVEEAEAGTNEVVKNPASAAGASSSQQPLRQPEFRLFGEPAARSQPLLPSRASTKRQSKPSSSASASSSTNRQSVLSQYFQPAKSPQPKTPAGPRRSLMSVSEQQRQQQQSSLGSKSSDDEIKSAKPPSSKKSRLQPSTSAAFKSQSTSSLLDRFRVSRPARVGDAGLDGEGDCDCADEN